LIASEIVERVELDTEGYAVILGGLQRRSLFTWGSDSHDPAGIALAPSATLRVVEVEVPGRAFPEVGMAREIELGFRSNEGCR